MTTCPSAPVPSSETAGSAPLLRDLLPAADVARLRTLRPAPPAPGLYAALNVIAQGLLCGQQVAHALQCLCFHKMVPLYINQCKYFYLIHYKEICRFVN